MSTETESWVPTIQPDTRQQHFHCTCSSMELKDSSRSHSYTRSLPAREFESKEDFVEHVLARQQKIHEIVRRNTHRAQLRQKPKFERYLKAKSHAVFSPYMLQHRAGISIPLSFIYPEFAAREFESKEEFVEHLHARQQEIHELVRRNTHQAQVRQKQKFDRHLKAKAHAVGDAVWVFCHIIHKGGTCKLLRAWRGPHKVTDVLQDGRLYVLDTGQKVHFERLKKHVPAPWDWAAHQPFGLDQNVAIIADPYVEESNEAITSDISRDSFLPEQLPEASFGM